MSAAAAAPKPPPPREPEAGEPEAMPADPAATGPPIGEVENAGLGPRDMLSFITASIDQDGLVGHNLHGYNDLIEHGINRIMTELFDIDRMLRNERTQTEGDRKRKSFQVRFQFHDVTVGKPTCTTYLTGQFTNLYPGRARLTGLPYSGPVTLGATATVRAFYEDGRVEERTAEIPPFQIGGFPTMVGGVNCHTANTSRSGLKEMGEDPTDPGGYFIAKRGEYVVDLLENIRYNSVHLHRRMKPNEHVRAEFLSQPGGAFENSSQIRVRFMTNGQLTVEINSMKFEKVRLPFYLVFRLFGMTDDRAVAETIVFDADGRGPLTAHMLDILERAFQLADANFAPLVSELNREKLVQMTAERVAKYLTNPTAYLNSESAIQFLNEDLLGSPSKPGGLDKVLLPHMGQTAESRVRKLRFLGLIIHKMLLVHLGVLPPTDRDSYRNKRVHGPGVSLAKAFKTQVNNSIVIPIFRAIKRELKNNPWESVTDKTLVDTFRNALTTSDLNRAMEQAITAGNKTIVVRRRAATNRVASQSLERKNSLNTFSALRTVVTQNAGNASKATERADMMRRVHPSYIGFICVSQSADTGENVGMRKQLAITASVCTAGEALPLKLRLLADGAVTALDLVASRDLLRRSCARVFVNGDWVGVCDDACALVARYRGLRRRGLVDPHATICWDPVTDEVEFWLDVGRLRRPLLVVDNNLAEYDAALHARHAHARAGGGPEDAPPRVEFVQNVRFTPAHVRAVVEGRLSLADLVRDGVAEYVTPEEQENCLLAESVAVLRRDRHDVTMRYSHCDVEQAIFGLAAHVSPFGNHTQPARVTYETNQGRQTGGWYVLNFPFRTDKNRFFQFYNEIPLVRTLTHKLVPANGTNVIIAYASYGGDNQEDSAIVCQASADRGLFAGAFFRYELAELEKGESFCNPDALATKNLKPNACYEKLVDGLIRVGSVVRYGDVLIGRVAKLSRGRAAAGADDRYTSTDRSVVYRLHEPAVVEAVLRPRGANDELFALVKLRYERPLRTGDKMCLTPDHEVLTADGWKPIAAVTTADRVATLDGGRLGYAAPTAVHEFEVDEDLYEIDAQMVSLRTTLNHRMYVKRRGATAFSFAEARDIMGARVSYKRDAVNPLPDAPDYVCWGGDGGDPDLAVPMATWLAILGAFIADGWVDGRSASYTIIAMTKRRKVEFLNGALAGTGIRHWHGSGKFVIDSPQIRLALAPYSVGALAKRLPDYVWRLSQGQARVLLDALLQGDGWRGPTNLMYCTSSDGLADDVQRLALHAGWSANKLFHRPAGTEAVMGDGRVITSNADSWRVSIIKAKNQPTVNHGHVREQKGQRELTLAYTGAVHCLTMPAGTFYVRRNGRPVWTGNSSRSGNKCLTPDHDALTGTRGWVPIADVTAADTVACLIDGRLEYRAPEAVHAYDHDGPMYEMSSQMVDLCVTPNHRMWAKPRGHNEYGFHEACAVQGRRVQYQRDAENPLPDMAVRVCYGGAGGAPDLELPMDAWLRLLGMFIGDGYTARVGYAVHICCCKRRKIDYMVSTMNALGVPGRYAQTSRAYVVTSQQIHDELEPLSVGALNKRLPAYVWALSQRQARILLDALVESDGHRAATNTRYCTSSAGLADDVQRLALHAGWSANIHVAHEAGFVSNRRLPDGGTQAIVCNADALQVSIVKARNRPMMNHPAIKYQGGQSEAMVDYRGPVHCLTVPGGVFYVRRHKKPVWTGNSIVALMLPQSDMPFTEDGLTPDMIINTHCVAGDTPITTYYGTSRRLDALPVDGGETLWGWSAEKGGFVESHQIARMARGDSAVVRVTLQDGRTLRCTPNHQVMTQAPDGAYLGVEAGLLTRAHRVVVGPEAPLDEPGADEAGWTFLAGDVTFSMADGVERERALAFARILGLLCSDGTITDNTQGRGVIAQAYLGHPLDVSVLLRDVQILTGKTPSATRGAETWTVRLPAELGRRVAVPGMAVGKKVHEAPDWPHFILDPMCPRALVREFLGGLYGGDGHAPGLVAHKAENRKAKSGLTRYGLSGVCFDLSIVDAHKDAMRTKMDNLCALLARVGVEGATVTGPTRRASSQLSVDGCPRLQYGVRIPPSTAFAARVGFRYCIQKSARLNAATAYWRFTENVRRQHELVFRRVCAHYADGLTLTDALDVAREDLLGAEPALNPYYSLLTLNVVNNRRRSAGRVQTLERLDYSEIEDAAKFFEAAGCLEWFLKRAAAEAGAIGGRVKTGYVTTIGEDFLAPFTLKVADVRRDGRAETYDISVPLAKTFVAGGFTVFNSFPSRMTIGQLIETTLGKVCARKGVIADGTAFLPVDHLAIAREMKALGFRFNGRERMYNGMTGNYFDAAIFVGPTAEQRLQKFVLDDEQSVAGSGPTDATTGQPLGGKHVQGGLRLGEMEQWGLESHGSMLNLFEKTSQDSDGRKMHVCRGCGAFAVFNEYHGVYQCRTCGEMADIATVDGSKSAMLLHEELAAANINVRLGLRPREFDVRPAAESALAESTLAAEERARDGLAADEAAGK